MLMVVPDGAGVGAVIESLPPHATAAAATTAAARRPHTAVLLPEDAGRHADDRRGTVPSLIRKTSARC